MQPSTCQAGHRVRTRKGKCQPCLIGCEPGVNDLLTTHPHVAADMVGNTPDASSPKHPINLTAEVKTSTRFTCPKCGGTYTRTLSAECSSRACPKCGRLSVVQIEPGNIISALQILHAHPGDDVQIACQGMFTWLGVGGAWVKVAPSASLPASAAGFDRECFQVLAGRDRPVWVCLSSGKIFLDADTVIAASRTFSAQIPTVPIAPYPSGHLPGQLAYRWGVSAASVRGGSLSFSTGPQAHTCWISAGGEVVAVGRYSVPR